MGTIWQPPRVRTNNFGQNIVSAKQPEDFKHLIGININEILSFDNGTDELLEQGRIILPRNYFLFVGSKDGSVEFKPYEYNEYRIVVATYKDIITSIDSIG